MKCHKGLGTCPESMTGAAGCSLWNAERNECSELTYYKAWGGLLTLQAQTKIASDNLSDSLEHFENTVVDVLGAIAEKLGVELEEG